MQLRKSKRELGKDSLLCLQEELGADKTQRIVHGLGEIEGASLERFEEFFHELNNILLIVMCWRDLGKQNARGKERLQEYYTKIVSEAGEKGAADVLCALVSG